MRIRVLSCSGFDLKSVESRDFGINLAERCFLTIAILGTAPFCIPRRYFDIGRFCVYT